MFNIDPENRPSQKESSLPTIIFHAKLRGVICLNIEWSSKSWNFQGSMSIFLDAGILPWSLTWYSLLGNFSVRNPSSGNPSHISEPKIWWTKRKHPESGSCNSGCRSCWSTHVSKDYNQLLAAARYILCKFRPQESIVVYCSQKNLGQNSGIFYLKLDPGRYLLASSWLPWCSPHFFKKEPPAIVLKLVNIAWEAAETIVGFLDHFFVTSWWFIKLVLLFLLETAWKSWVTFQKHFGDASSRVVFFEVGRCFS